ncbi:hypothetical protein CHS0354_020069 [Potamilus streckersoni]|uniref:Protein pinocchio n=1 Tax=Potamilus streckersoni TaxID=2493646 RepID=A0AAE0SDA1_9BIVA|nr:hypothetical protein CHS0354_020069 [Potamilus streckersoni]
MEGDWVTERDKDEGFAELDSQEDEAMETNMAAEGEDELLSCPRNTVFYTLPLSEAEYVAQGKDFTKEQVDGLLKSQPYQRKISTCHLCNQCWYDGKFDADCPECGGFALQRPCPICNGQCSNIWCRDIKSSHSFHEAHWDGECGLPPAVRQVFMLQNLTDSSENALSEGMQDLSTR